MRLGTYGLRMEAADKEKKSSKKIHITVYIAEIIVGDLLRTTMLSKLLLMSHLTARA